MEIISRIRSKYLRGLKIGVIKRKIRKVRAKQERKQAKAIIRDLRHANTDLLDYLCAVEFEGLNDVTTSINVWLSFEAEMTGYNVKEYRIGGGDNLFKLINIEREIYNRKQVK